MAEQFTYRDLCPPGGGLGKELSQGIVESEFSSLHQHHYRSCRELLADGPGLEERLGLDWDTQLNVGQSIAFGTNRFTIARHQQRQSGNLLVFDFDADSLGHLIDDWSGPSPASRHRQAQDANCHERVFQRKVLAKTCAPKAEHRRLHRNVILPLPPGYRTLRPGSRRSCAPGDPGGSITRGTE